MNFKKSKITGFVVIWILVGLVYSLPLSGKKTGAQDWPRFHGPKGDNISMEKGLLKKWPQTGPKLLWTASGLGKGYSSMVISRNMVFTAGSLKNNTFVFALDHQTGKILWKRPNGKKWVAGNMRWARDYDGARATPLVHEGVVYHLGEMGDLSALNAKYGALVWSVNLLETFKGTLPRYGYSESLLIDGKKLICYPGGSEGFMVALDIKTGKTIWANKDIGQDPGYATPILVEDQGIRQIITLTTAGVVGVNADNGKFLWHVEHTNKRKLNIANAVYHQGYVCISSGYRGGTILVKLTYQDKKIKAEKVWFNEELDNHHGGIILLEGFIYGTGHQKKGWYALDFKTGKTVLRDREGGKGSFMLADNMFYYFTEKGVMNLVKPSPESMQIISTFRLPEKGKGFYWAHPVVCNGRLYLRFEDSLYAYRIK